MTARAVVLSSGKRPEHPADPGMLAAIFAAAERQCGHRECAWCGRFLGLAEGIGLGQVSHGICNPPCAPARAQGWRDFPHSMGAGGPDLPADKPSESNSLSPAPASPSVVGHGASPSSSRCVRPSAAAAQFLEVVQ